MNMVVSFGMTWRGLVFGAIFFGGHGLCCALAAGGGADQVGDADNGNPYGIITNRNPFRMNPPPIVQTVVPVAAEVPEVIFSGTMINAGHQKAMFAVRVKPSKDPRVAAAAGPQETTTYLCLAEGDTEGPVQLLKITKGGEEVEIMNSGTRMTLNMKDNGFAKESPAPRGGGPAGMVRNLPGANPNIPMPGPMQGQAGAAGGDYGGLKVAGAANESYRGGVNVAGFNGANPTGGTLIGGNRGGTPQTISTPGANNSVFVGGAPNVAANPIASTAPTGMKIPAFNSPGNLGSPASLPPNNTPTATIPVRNVDFPPMPPASGH